MLDNRVYIDQTEQEKIKEINYCLYKDQVVILDGVFHPGG